MYFGLPFLKRLQGRYCLERCTLNVEAGNMGHVRGMCGDIGEHRERMDMYGNGGRECTSGGEWADFFQSVSNDMEPQKSVPGTTLPL